MSKKLVVIDCESCRVIAELPFETLWEPYSEEWDRLIDTERNGCAVSILLYNNHQDEFYYPSTEPIWFPTIQHAKKACRLLSRFRFHSIAIIDTDDAIAILIGKKEKAKDFAVHYKTERIFKKLVVVDYNNKQVIAEIPAAHRHRMSWAEPPNFRLDGRMVGIVGVLSSENWTGPSGANYLELVTEYDYEINDEYVDACDPPDPYVAVDCFAFPSEQDAQAAATVLGRLVGTGVVGTRMENDTYEILALSKDLVKLYPECTSSG